MRTTIRMNKELARRAKEYAAVNRHTFTDVVEEALTRLLAERPKCARRGKIILPTAGDPRNRVTEAQYRSAIERMYEEEAASIRRGAR